MSHTNYLRDQRKLFFKLKVELEEREKEYNERIRIVNKTLCHCYDFQSPLMQADYKLATFDLDSANYIKTTITVHYNDTYCGYYPPIIIEYSKKDYFISFDDYYDKDGHKIVVDVEKVKPFIVGAIVDYGVSPVNFVNKYLPSLEELNTKYKQFKKPSTYDHGGGHDWKIPIEIPFSWIE